MRAPQTYSVPVFGRFKDTRTQGMMHNVYAYTTYTTYT